MRITRQQDVKTGHYVTFRSTRDGILGRRIYQILGKGTSGWQCTTKINSEYTSWKDAGYDTVIDNLFECPDDEVFSEWDDIKENYPEELI